MINRFWIGELYRLTDSSVSFPVRNSRCSMIQGSDFDLIWNSWHGFRGRFVTTMVFGGSDAVNNFEFQNTLGGITAFSRAWRTNRVWSEAKCFKKGEKKTLGKPKTKQVNDGLSWLWVHFESNWTKLILTSLCFFCLFFLKREARVCVCSLSVFIRSNIHLHVTGADMQLAPWNDCAVRTVRLFMPMCEFCNCISASSHGARA